MNAVAANVITVDFGSAPVLSDFATASVPKCDFAQRLAAEASVATSNVVNSTDKKAGKLRIMSTDRADLFNLNPYLIKIKAGWNSRVIDDPENIRHIDTLARSIAKRNVQVPLTVALEGNDVFVTDGHCRLLATFRAIEVYGAEIKSVPCRAESRFASEADRVLSQIVRNSGKPLTVLEQGAVFVKLIGFGWSVSQIAENIGLGPTRVSQILDLVADASDNIKTLIGEGRVSATVAAQALRDADGDAQVAERTIQSGLVIARASGKARATLKHLAGLSKKPSVKAELFKLVTMKNVVRGKKETIVPNEVWNRLLALAGAI